MCTRDVRITKDIPWDFCFRGGRCTGVKDLLCQPVISLDPGIQLYMVLIESNPLMSLQYEMIGVLGNDSAL